MAIASRPFICCPVPSTRVIGHATLLNWQGVHIEKVRLKHYDQGVPATLDYPHITLHRQLEDTAERLPDNTTIVFPSALGDACRPIYLGPTRWPTSWLAPRWKPHTQSPANPPQRGLHEESLSARRHKEKGSPHLIL